MRKLILLSALILYCGNILRAQLTKDEVLLEMNRKSEVYGGIAQNIWEFAEMGYLEEKSSSLLQKTLRDEGFTIKKGVAG
ncbi:MAG: amidohydrolase, partial [Flavobacteriaceae bacterium]